MTDQAESVKGHVLTECQRHIDENIHEQFNSHMDFYGYLFGKCCNNVAFPFCIMLE